MIMIKLKIKLNSINDVRDFVTTVNMHPFDVDLVCGRYVVDAKSLMGIFSLDLSKSIDVEIHQDKCQSLIDALERFKA